MKRTLPNILITGTPGTGKSTLASQLTELTTLQWLNVSEIAKEHNLVDNYDDTLQCHEINEGKVISELEDQIEEGGKIVEYHGCDFFPEDWFDIVFVLTTDNTVLYDRLVRRGYAGKKLENNVQCEIFQVLLDEAKGSYDPNIVFPLKSNTPDDMEDNIENIYRWVESYKANRANG